MTNAVRLAPLLNSHIVQAGSPHTILIPRASRLAKITDITVRGILLKKHLTSWDPRTLKRRVTLGKRGGQYTLEEDGSLMFCVGVRELQPHIVCRIQDGLPWLLRLKQSVGMKVSVGGFLRCSFDSPGFDPRDNAHIFEIHPVRNLETAGELHSCELGVPDRWIQGWTADLNRLDERREARYWKGTDMLVFTNIETEREKYIRVTGHVSDITLNVSTNRPAWFILTSADLARQVKVTCLQGTQAARQLRSLNSGQVTVVGLRSIDLARALEERYRINLLAMEISV